MTPKRVLIVCSANSIRSQMAEGLWRSSRSEDWEVFSAGAFGSGSVHPLAVRVMQELGINIKDQFSKNLGEFRDTEFDLLVTVCDRARGVCEGQVQAKEQVHWSIEDPTLYGPDEQSRMDAFRRVRDDLKTRIEAYCELNRET